MELLKKQLNAQYHLELRCGWKDYARKEKIHERLHSSRPEIHLVETSTGRVIPKSATVVVLCGEAAVSYIESQNKLAKKRA
jgi:hypothetical protein